MTLPFLLPFYIFSIFCSRFVFLTFHGARRAYGRYHNPRQKLIFVLLLSHFFIILHWMEASDMDGMGFILFRGWVEVSLRS